MSVQLVRPDVSDLVLRTFSRALHPELFDRQCGLMLSHSDLRLDLRLNASGHVLMLRMGKSSFTEVIVDHRLPMAKTSKIVDYRLRGCRTESKDLGSGIRYDMSCQLERLSLDVFLRMHEELDADCRQADLCTRFPAINRLLPGPLSLIRAQITRGSILIYAFHTFPEHGAIVKTQSLFEQTDGNH